VPAYPDLKLTNWPRDGAGSRPSANEKDPVSGAFREERMMGLEPTTFCMASRRSSQLSYIRVVDRV
jgi:hypothetical protein